jgi:hypothetical protein
VRLCEGVAFPVWHNKLLFNDWGGLAMITRKKEIVRGLMMAVATLVAVGFGAMKAPAQPAAAPAGGQEQILFYEDFERGPGTPVDKIRRYPDKPQVVDSDPMSPGAFPPPSGRFAARASDTKGAFHGLGSVAVGPIISLDNPTIFPLAIEAKLWLVPSKQYNYKNVALLALDDEAGVEQYYRFGYGNSALYFQFFDGRGFTEILYDPVLGEQIAVPGWHTLTMRFDSADTINFFVDGRMTNFSPLKQTSIKRFRVGALIWDQEGTPAAPILADDFKIYKPSASAQTAVQAPKVSVEEIRKIKPLGPAAPAGKPAEWLTDTNLAVQRAQEEGGKKFLVYFCRPGVGECATIEGNTLLNPAIADAINRFVPVRIDAGQNRALVDKFEVYKVPQLIVIDMQSRLYWRRLGVVSASDLEQALARY